MDADEVRGGDDIGIAVEKVKNRIVLIGRLVGKHLENRLEERHAGSEELARLTQLD